MKSRPYKLGDKLFRYDFDSSMVEYILKAEPVEIEAEREWPEKHDGPLYGIGADRYMVLDTIGLNRKNWENRAARDEYLSGWAVDLDAEAEALAADFLRWEM